MLINKKIGFYSVDNLDFDSKIRACLFASQHNKKVTWNFNNEQFGLFDWSVEPYETLDELYDKRAREIREKYDYVLLSYSGGSDSHNMLMSFVRQNLLVDEIVVNCMNEANKNFIVLDKNVKSSWNTGAEHFLQTLPRLKELETKLLKTKITIVDLSQYLFKAFLDYGDESWVMDRREGLNPLNVTRYNYAYFKDLRTKFDKSFKIALVVGIEKPKTFIKDNVFKIQFTDRSANIVPIDDHLKDYSNSSMEFFYWSPDSTRMLCKQAHTIKKWLENNPEKMYLWEADSITPSRWRLVHEKVLRNLIYSTWNENWFQTDKSISDWNSEFDQWFYRGYSDTATYKIWKSGIDYMISNAPRFLKYRPDGTPDGLMVFNNVYTIENMNYIDKRL